ncbi:MAG: phosphoglucosamine mutase [Atribacterota bacterium]|nr:phosphoglucosamine mutase [Atribacterota bacterium]
MANLFGTDGIRGLANQYPMTAEVALNLGRAIGYYFKNSKNINILIGRDTRISGDMLEYALSAGLCSTGISVLDAGIVTTPAVAYLTKYFKASMGIVISASHNPYYDNGIKFFFSDGMKFDNEKEEEIENILINEKYKKINISGKNIGKIELLRDAKKIYIDYIINSTSESVKNSDYKIIIDCANGAASILIEELYSRLKIKNFSIINNFPNGTNINQNCGSTNLIDLQKKVVSENADLGLAYDGDADRVLAVDEKGEIVDGDQIMAIYANAFLKKGILGNNLIVTTHMSNLGFDETIEKIGGKVIRTDIGDKNVLRKMLEENAALGGEQSGHIIFLKNSPNGDGIVTSLKLLEALSSSNKRISLQASIMKKYHQKLLNYDIVDKEAMLNSEEYSVIKNDIQNMISGKGRVFIRPSGTEKKIRVLLESKDKNIIDKCKNNFDEFMKKYE